MQVISTNIGEPRIIEWRGQEVKTGIYKFPGHDSIFLGKEDVVNDHVMDRRFHGGTDKACYLFSEIHYQYWKNLYPDMDWQWGMFGENLTVSGLDESKIKIGDIFRIGEVVVQVTQPRQPCFKLGVKFGSQKIVKQFIDYGYPGVYVRVIETGNVKTGDRFKIIESSDEAFSISEVFRLIYTKEAKPEAVSEVIADPNLADSCRKDLKKIWGL